MKYALIGARIFDGYSIVEQSALLVENDQIIDIVPSSSVGTSYEKIELQGGLLAPGFIDLQINGAGGVLLNNAPTEETMQIMADSIAAYGVTRILPTLISDDQTVTREAVQAALSATKKNSGVLGIHIEGPFFNSKKSGVHQKDKIRVLQEDDWDWLTQLAAIPAIVTLAPEKMQLDEIEKMDRLGIRICAGHTNAHYDDIAEAHEKGLSGFTHLFNAMRAMNSREPGVVGAALSLNNTWAGIIADGIHVHPASINTAIEAKSYEKIFLVSDAMATVASDTNQFKLYNETIELKDGQLINSEGRLAGSAISLLDAVQYCINEVNIPAEKVLAMASRVPAEFMQLDDQFGTFSKGKTADICWLSDDWNIQKVWRSGKPLI